MWGALYRTETCKESGNCVWRERGLGKARYLKDMVPHDFHFLTLFWSLTRDVKFQVHLYYVIA